DGILELIKPGYKKARRDYLKTLRQRNALLKRGPKNSSEMFPWNVRLSHLGGTLAAARHELTHNLNKDIGNTYKSLSSSKDKITLTYKSAVELNAYESLLLKKLELDYELDLLRRFTAHGPHREDLEVLINKKLPSNAASRGETRTITIALKTLEHNLISEHAGRPPIILLDDVFSELDETRINQLASLINENQSIITSTSISDKLRKLKHANLIKTNQLTNTKT
ncbi:MAG: hypothetical protein ACREF7_01225, partial [Candidatus Saccharimonadales bacterium]